MAQNIYFDESGFTGNNLLNEKQNYFAYASVATNPDEAKEVVERIMKQYRVQGGELKGKYLVRRHQGKLAIDDILTHFEGRVKISISDKKYALAGKFFEYIFEPSLSEISTLFYGINFHLFIANILYVEFIARGAGAEDIFNEFEALMREMDEEKLASLFSSSMCRGDSPILTQIREFAIHQIDDIRAELDSLRGGVTGKWILDLTGSALGSLLAHWGLMHDEITAICDESKPLMEKNDFFDGMIGRKGETIFVDSPTGKQPLTFNLSGPIQFASSAVEHGIQIADTLAAAAVFAVTNPDDPMAQKWCAMLPEIGSYGSVIPDFDHLDLNGMAAKLNALVLMELHSRATKKQNLLVEMPEYVQFMAHALRREAIGLGPRMFKKAMP
ncbi:DUF3800 domain-containing protein [Janthinobacterium sp. PAMC25594]|uniref:DUF3800 domain-containing protein n=1 Tax=Janthinobacterium sp. PAMC25594 TaxID=2861284 RepID=UPI001C637056|nr:DUF3800 domain-containing protein [Janthinobacterium sp. PAMC25594]QYG06061.1 DUF3800 domain-containing protein [Janthinobacterium sp. PAMC25594]